MEGQSWVEGDRRYGAIHRGRTYLFTSPEQQRKFMADPDRFSPVLSGNDPVLSLQSGRPVPGFRKYGLFYGRIYLFANEDSLLQFTKNPQRYAAEVLQAERPTNNLMR